MTNKSTFARIPRFGDPAPVFVTQSIDGENITLATIPKPAVLVFLRHLA